MKMFVFESLSQVSGNHHSGGGMMVIAKSEEHVMELIKGEIYIDIDKEEWKNVKVFELKKAEPPAVFVFPDAGCC